jgi:heme exporter protein A
MISLETIGLGKRFGRRKIFEEIDFSLQDKGSLVITGKNGSGKTTLLKILCGLIRPTQGRILIRHDGEDLTIDKSRNIFGLVMPDLELYAELTALENLYFLSRIRGMISIPEDLMKIISWVGLEGRENDFVFSFSSGMKQRLKYAFALLHEPNILLLDEPTANLDDEGIELAEKIITLQKEKGILIIATNRKEDFEYGDKILQLGI